MYLVLLSLLLVLPIPLLQRDHGDQADPLAPTFPSPQLLPSLLEYLKRETIAAESKETTVSGQNSQGHK